MRSALLLLGAAVLGALAPLVALPASAMMDSFTVTLRFVAPLSSQYQAVFNAAVNRWEEVITGTGANTIVRLGQNTPPLCFGEPESALPDGITFNDLLIFVKVVNIDGVGKILGQAGVCAFDRAPIPKPRVGWMELDLADVANLYAKGQLRSVVLHEIGHILGIGTSWGYLRLTRPRSFAYRGRYGNEANRRIGYKKQALIENTGQRGTRRVHWRETQYKNELMTGYISGATQPLSLLTVESLKDLGYSVDASRADEFSAATAKRRGKRTKRGLALRGAGDAEDAGEDDNDDNEEEEEKTPYHSPHEKHFGPPISIDTVPP